jgi:hypothetical protein
MPVTCPIERSDRDTHRHPRNQHHDDDLHERWSGRAQSQPSKLELLVGPLTVALTATSSHTRPIQRPSTTRNRRARLPQLPSGPELIKKRSSSQQRRKAAGTRATISTASVAARCQRWLRTRPPGSGSSGDGNVGGPKVEIASELVGLFPHDVRLWRLAPRLRDAEHWSQRSAEAHRMATGPPLGRGEDAESIEGNSFISPTHTGGA